jgi:thiopurine S-methyltransferase
MEHNFWYECWDKDQIGFHLPKPHELLQRHWKSVDAEKGSTVLVPLCGKTLDLQWLAQQGHQVIGVELSEKAVDAFFSEQQLTPERDQTGPFQRYRCGSLTVLCGDFFALSTEHTGKLDYLYDRAAIGALPEAMRGDYAKHLHSLMPTGSRGLSINNEFNQDEMPGPPFSVPPQTMSALFDSGVEVTCLETLDSLVTMPILQERGLTRFEEHALLISFK